MKALQLLSEWIIILPFFTGVLLFRKMRINSRIIFLIVCAAFMPQLATTFLKNIDKEALNILYNIYTPIEFYLLLFFFATRLSRSRLLYFLGFIFFLVVFYFFYSFGVELRVLSELICLANLFYVFLIFFYFLNMFRNHNYLFSLNDSFNWHILGWLLYAPCTFFLFADYLNTSANLQQGKSVLWIVHNIFNITLYLSFTMGFVKDSKQIRTS